MPEQPEPTPHEPEQLVVDLQHLPVVLDELKDLGVAFAGDIDQDDRLGLARLKTLRDSLGEVIDLDALMAEVRQQIAAKRDGWVPTMGTNRWVDTIVGAGHKPMSGAEPAVASEADLPKADETAPGAGKGVRVGIVDTPLFDPDAAHPGPVSIHAGHSTFVSGLILQQAPAATAIVKGALDPSTGRTDSWTIATAMMQLAAGEAIDILNLSLGSYVAAGPPLAISRAVERLTPRVLVVAAAGNHGEFLFLERGRTSRSAIWPGAIPPVVAVGATDPGGDRPPWSPGLPWITCTALGVDVVAPYVNAQVALSGGPVRFDGFARWSGTSFAAATVTGAIAAKTQPGKTPASEALTQVLNEGTVAKRFT